jgi:hypothetical protein
VVRLPSEFSKTTGSPPSMTAMQEFVVPKSMPSTFAIKFKKLVVYSPFLRNYNAAISETTWKYCKQRIKLSFPIFEGEGKQRQKRHSGTVKAPFGTVGRNFRRGELHESQTKIRASQSSALRIFCYLNIEHSTSNFFSSMFDVGR